MKPKRLGFATFLMTVGIVACLPASQPAHAQDSYPSRPIRVIVPYAPGGYNDIVTRLIADRLSPVLATPFIVENRPGGGGKVGAAAVATAPPDGYTLLFGGNTNFVLNPLMERNIGYDPVKGFVPIALVGHFPMIVITPKGRAVDTFPDLLTKIRSLPAGAVYGTAGVGTPTHLAGAWLARLAGAKAAPAHYRGGAAILADVINGHLDYSLATLAVATNRDRINIVASVTHEPIPGLTGVPAIVDAGLPQFRKIDWITWNGFFAPGNTPRPIVEKLNGAIYQVLKDESIKMRFAELGGWTLETRSPDEIAIFIRRAIETMREPLRELGVIPE
ncbi:MAG: tripartite tricarboxylate transporter substrate binding protein [Xanthobacteraceae bacterium]|nr:tripartite tricarboxylate transporter substrate binding protein [Xanthobacteraceae bacterium]